MPDMKMQDVLSEMAGEIAGTWVIIVADNDGMLLSFWNSPDNKLPPEALGGFIQTVNSAIDAFKQSTAGFGMLNRYHPVGTRKARVNCRHHYRHHQEEGDVPRVPQPAVTPAQNAGWGGGLASPGSRTGGRRDGFHV